MRFLYLSKHESFFIDLLRALSIQCVFFGHMFSFLQIPTLKNILIQNMGVMVFFIISGFLITYTTVNKIIHKSNYTFKNFFFDRFFRIYVTLIPSLFIVFLVDYTMPTNMFDGAYNWKTFFGNILMLQDFPRIHFVTSYGSNRVLWTIAVEWSFYMAFGYIFLYFFSTNYHRKGERIYIDVIYNKSNLCRWVILTLLMIVPLHNLMGRGHGLTFTWLLGVSLVFLRAPLMRLPSLVLKMICVLDISAIPMTWVNNYEFYGLSISIELSVLILCALLIYYKNPLLIPKTLKKFVTYNARSSYALYLVHYPIMQYFTLLYQKEGSLLNNQLIVTIGLILFFCYFFSYVIYFLFDRNYKKIQKYFLSISRNDG